MRLRLFDRIRWLAHPRRPPADSAGASGAQGRHRRGRRRGPVTAPASPSFPGGPGFPGDPGSHGEPDPARGHAPSSGEWSTPGGPPGEWCTPGGPPGGLAHTASPWPGSSPVSEAPVAPGQVRRRRRVVQPGRGPIAGWAEPAGTPGRPRCAPGRLGRGSVRRPRMPRRSAWARPRDQCQPRPVRGRAGTNRPSRAGRSLQKSACPIPGRQSWPGSRPASRVNRTGPADLPGGPAGRPRTPGCLSRLPIPGNGRGPGTAAGIAARSRPSCGGSGTRRRRRPGKWWRPSTGWPNFPSGSRKGWPTASTRSSSAPAASRNSMT